MTFEKYPVKLSKQVKLSIADLVQALTLPKEHQNPQEGLHQAGFPNILD